MGSRRIFGRLGKNATLRNKYSEEYLIFVARRIFVRLRKSATFRNKYSEENVTFEVLGVLSGWLGGNKNIKHH